MLGAGFDIGWKYFDGLGFSGGCEVLPGGYGMSGLWSYSHVTKTIP